MDSSLYKDQIPIRVKGQTTCIHHNGKQLDLYCEECHELACTKCLSTIHKKHHLCDLSEITPKKKEDIQNFIDKIENVDLVEIDQYITATDTQLKDNVSHFEKLSQQLKTQTNRFKQELDLLTAQTLCLYQQMEEDNTKLLQTYKQDLEIYSTQLKQQVQECRVVLQRGSDIQIYKIECDIQSPVTLPVKLTLCTASFTPNRNPQSQLEQALGKVRPSTPQRSKRTHPLFVFPVHSLMPRAKVLEEWYSSFHITSICPTTEGQVWTSSYSKTLTLLDRKGNVIQEVEHNTDIMDISLSSTTNTLWICDQKNNITELVSGRLVHRFSIREEALNICITASNHVIVGMAKHISKFTTEGELVLSTSTARTENPLVCIPWRISECPVTHNVAVVEWDIKDDDDDDDDVDDDGKHHVVVMDTDFKELFEYDGEVPHTYQPGGGPFYPYDVVYDSKGNLVIADCFNNRVLLISGLGEFLRIIHTDSYCNRAVGVDRDDDLWTVFWFENVKILHLDKPDTPDERDEQPCVILLP
ncbi:uncharacterized protein LOC110453549 [Mizuhopecten yessoensis]|uniref:uncharacterized protein LOC110453549 n=1 Tax=Mizuhopecten yessoensis TaxID=6573 RepID=UPI000B459AC2|nr:uncharacterized protein LOC110453549 [Mizuhopecten yessoensis]